MVQRVGRGIAVLFMTAALEGVSGHQHAPTALYPGERPGTHFNAIEKVNKISDCETRSMCFMTFTFTSFFGGGSSEKLNTVPSN